nr:unnamed protein product [Spirometra erinaceieuropaei]
MKALTREINATLFAMENSGAISPIDRRMARTQKRVLARFYGLPKVHKEDTPLRPILSLKVSPTYGLAKWLFRRLKFLTSDSNTTVSSSTQFLEKLKGDLPIDTIELLLQSKYDETENRLGHAQVLQLLKFCHRTYFIFDGTNYEQVKDTPIETHRRGGPATLDSPVFRHHIPKCWARYVDYTFVVIERDQVLTFKEHLNAVFPDFQFTMEEEENNQLASLDVQAARVLSKVERDALKELRADSDLVIVPADKGRSTVVLDRTDYNRKAKSLLEDRQSYVSCELNPIKTLTREINATLFAMENSGAISPIDRRMARAQETVLARFYGLPKVHKVDTPLRPILSLKVTPTYGLAKWLFRRLKFLTSDSNTTVSSSTQFLEKLKGDLAVETIEILLREKYDEAENCLGHAQIMHLLKFCLKTYFTFDETIYEQMKGAPMGLPISGLIAEAVLQRLESLVF